MSSKNESTRDRILNAAWRLLETEGGSTVRMGDIAKAANISRQALYLHFPNRADLLIATTRHLDAVHDIDARLAESRGAATGVERLGAWIEVWGNYIPSIHGVARALMAMQDHDAEARAAWSDRMAAMRQGCAAAVAALQADGTLKAGLDTTEATDLLWTLLSVRVWEHLRQDCGWSQERYIAVTQDMASRALVETWDLRASAV